jgi:hypothetical protein
MITRLDHHPLATFQAVIAGLDGPAVVDPAQQAAANTARVAAQRNPNFKQCAHCSAYFVSDLEMVAHIWNQHC